MEGGLHPLAKCNGEARQNSTHQRRTDSPVEDRIAAVLEMIETQVL